MEKKLTALRIVELRAENVKRLKAVAVRPQGDVVVVSGKNGQGKTSLLDSIVYALGGKETHATEVIRRGEDSAQVVLDLGDLVVERKWHKGEKGEVTTVVVRAKDGARYPSPQAILDGLYGRLTFDPLGFMRLPPAKQLEQLKELAGLNLAPLDGKRQDLYEKRTDVNRRGGDLKARFLAMPTPPANLPAEPVDLKALLAEQEQMRSRKSQNDSVRRMLEGARADGVRAKLHVTDAAAAIERLERDLLAARADHERAVTKLVNADVAVAELEKDVAALVDPDFAAIGQRIVSAEGTNVAIVRAKDHARIGAELEALRAEKDVLTAAIDNIDAEKAKAVGAAKFPVPGLGLGANGPTLNELPLEQASSAEQLRVSVAMGLAVNPTLKVLLVRDGSLLDTESMELVGAMAQTAGAQIWIERVADKAGVGVVIEDGEAREIGIAQAPPAKTKLRAVGGEEGGAA